MAVAQRARALWRDYLDGLRQMPQLLRRISFKPRTLDEELQEVGARESSTYIYYGQTTVGGGEIVWCGCMLAIT